MNEERGFYENGIELMQQKSRNAPRKKTGGIWGTVLGVAISFVMILVFLFWFLNLGQFGQDGSMQNAGEQITEAGYSARTVEGENASSDELAVEGETDSLKIEKEDFGKIEAASPADYGNLLNIDGLFATIPEGWYEMDGYYYAETGVSVAMFFYETFEAEPGDVDGNGSLRVEAAERYLQEIAEGMLYQNNAGRQSRVAEVENVLYAGRQMFSSTIEFRLEGLPFSSEFVLYYHEESGNIIVFDFGQSNNCMKDHFPEFHTFMDSLK